MRAAATRGSTSEAVDSMEQRSDWTSLELRKNIGVPADLQNGRVETGFDSKGLTLLTPGLLLLSINWRHSLAFQSSVAFRCDRSVGGFGDDLSLDPACVLAVNGVLQGRWHEDVAAEREQLVRADLLRSRSRSSPCAR